MSILAVIPVRMGSSRFYGKPLKLIHGISMVNRIFKIVSKSKVIEKADNNNNYYYILFYVSHIYNNKLSKY